MRTDALTRMNRIRTIHFVGIGGAGMSGIAEVLMNLGYAIQGSDVRPNAATERLTKLGARVFMGHDPKNIQGADVVVVSGAIKGGNFEVVAAHDSRVPVMSRAQMLGELMRLRQSIAVAGTHGKTTTTSLLASILAEAGEDPTFVIGGLLKSAGSNARLGAGRYLVAEADESDASFTHLQPLIAIVTNIDKDHLGTHGGDFERLKKSFVEFLHNLPFYGLAVLCRDDRNVRSIFTDMRRPFVAYGLDEYSDVRAVNIVPRGLRTSFQVVRYQSTEAPLDVTLNLPGTHNVRNALAAITVAFELEIATVHIQRALSSFEGVDRRMQHIGDVDTPSGRVTIIDDYGHHPTEIEATLDALRQGYAGRRVVLAFQPHRYTRTRDLLGEFGAALAKADVVLVTEVYAAGEAPIAGADGRAICDAVRACGRVEPIFVEKVEELSSQLAGLIRADDLIVTMGAGNITAVAHGLPEKLRVPAARRGST